ncbi:hypothetical protein HPP92_010116 [Vanilla planifolia]|uniref:GDSL esterase/lipase n=1 Tax=Vanilla planifolia TaxID=51239 RepID=A0A835UZD9_VANPL|nr:hypothetical protein HPP92_010116 [Vanilla planifolia]
MALLPLFFLALLSWAPVESLGHKALYVLGDSLADVGNNNYLSTLLKANFPYNGVDFAGGKATGRFSNGKNAADFLGPPRCLFIFSLSLPPSHSVFNGCHVGNLSAEKLGFASPPPYLAITSTTNKSYAFFQGVNFASGGAGILDSTNKGKCLSFNKQIVYFSKAYKAMVGQAGSCQTQEHLAKSVFAIFIGSNDIFGHLQESKASPQQFVTSLTSTFRKQLTRMYKLGARKFVVVGTGALGCCPSLRSQNRSGDCNVWANSVSDLYNQAAASLLREMKTQLGDMNYSFFNTYLAFLELILRPEKYGFTEVKAACCGLGDLNAEVACTPFSSHCRNRKDHVFWDYYHPTEATVKLLVAEMVDGTAPLVYPVNAKRLSAL